MGLDPEMRALADEVVALQRQTTGARDIAQLTPEAVRAWMPVRRQTLGRGPEVGWSDLELDGADGRMPARLYTPPQGGPALWIWFHGGGGVVGSIDDQHEICKLMALTAGVDVLSVDYRLAPEHPFPAAVEDAFATVTWASEHLAGGRPLIVGGESAGGALAAVAARRSRDRGGPPVALQILVHPMVGVDFDTGSYLAYGGGDHLLSRDLMRWFWGHYVPREADRTNPDAVPLAATDLRGLPPAMVVLAELDPLHDEGAEYARRLTAAGVPTRLRTYPGVTHGFWVWAPRLGSGRRAVEDVAGWISRID